MPFKTQDPTKTISCHFLRTIWFIVMSGATRVSVAMISIKLCVCGKQGQVLMRAKALALFLCNFYFPSTWRECTNRLDGLLCCWTVLFFFCREEKAPCVACAFKTALSQAAPCEREPDSMKYDKTNLTQPFYWRCTFPWVSRLVNSSLSGILRFD